MRWNDVYLNASAAWLGEREDVQAAVADGRYDAEEYQEDDYAYVRVAGDISAADMAVEAGRLAVERSGVPREEFDLLAHATFGFSGIDHWAPPAYIQARTVQGRASALEVRQASNSGMAALDVAAAYVTARGGSSAALVTTSEKYVLPAFDRYRSDKALLRGDGATAAVLSHRPGVARVLSTVVVGDAEHEGFYRGDAPWSDLPQVDDLPIDLRARRVEYLQAGRDVMDVVRTLTGRQLETMEAALADAQLDSGDISWWVLPNAGRSVQDWELRKKFGIDESKTTWPWGREVGHIGGGDQIAGLTHLLETRSVAVGDRVALSGVGAGFVFGCAVLEILDVPEWTNSAG